MLTGASRFASESALGGRAGEAAIVCAQAVDPYGREGERSLCAAEAHLGSQFDTKRFEEVLDRVGIARQCIQGAHGARGKLNLSRGADQLNVGERLLKVAARTAR